jgi:hypothetical protein
MSDRTGRRANRGVEFRDCKDGHAMRADFAILLISKLD